MKNFSLFFILINIIFNIPVKVDAEIPNNNYLKGSVYPYTKKENSIGFKEFYIGQSRKEVIKIIKAKYKENKINPNPNIIAIYQEERRLNNFLLELNNENRIWLISILDDTFSLYDYEELVISLKQKYGEPGEIIETDPSMKGYKWYFDKGNLCISVNLMDVNSKSGLYVLSAKYYYVPIGIDQWKELKEKSDKKYSDF